MNTKDLTDEALASLWLQTKAAEKEAQQQRLEIEEAMIALLGAREEGAKTVSLPNGMTVTITGKLSYKADIPQLITLADQLPEHLRPIKTETKLDEAGAKYLRANEPDLYRLIAPAIEIKPAKTGLTVKEP